MAVERKVTDLTSKTTGNLLETDVYYMVDTTDMTEDPAGSSFKTTLEAMLDAVVQLRGAISSGLATLDSFGKLNLTQFPTVDSSLIEYDNSTGVLDVGDITVDLALDKLAMFSSSSGQVKVNTGNSVKPIVSHTTTGAGVPTAPQFFTYISPLGISSSPTTNYPRGEPNKNETSIFDFTNGTFLEYQSLGSVNLFRFTINWTKPGALTNKFILRFRIYNDVPPSTFSLTDEIYISEETSFGEKTFIFFTIADQLSLPSPLGTGHGYKVTTSIVGDVGSECDIILDNFVRFNTENTYIAP